MKLDELDIHAIGNTIQIAGVIYAGEGLTLLCFFPDEIQQGIEIQPLEMDLDDWTRFLRQTDLMETEVLAKAKDGKITKAILRKCQRQIDQRVSWAVYRRDGFKCRYCAADEVPLTVDHLVLWEEGGPSTEDNLVTCCKKCNKTRGNTQLADWFQHQYYRRVSKKLAPHVRALNEDLLNIIPNIPRRPHKVSR